MKLGSYVVAAVSTCVLLAPMSCKPKAAKKSAPAETMEEKASEALRNTIQNMDRRGDSMRCQQYAEKQQGMQLARPAALEQKKQLSCDKVSWRDRPDLVPADTAKSTADAVDTMSDTDSDDSVNPSPTIGGKRRDFKAELTGSRIIFYGGTNIVGRSKSIDIYDTATNSWSRSQLQYPVEGDLHMVIAGNSVLLGSEGSQIVESYNVETKQMTSNYELIVAANLPPVGKVTPSRQGTKGSIAVFLTGDATKTVFLQFDSGTKAFSQFEFGKTFAGGDGVDLDENGSIFLLLRNGKAYPSLLAYKKKGSSQWLETQIPHQMRIHHGSPIGSFLLLAGYEIVPLVPGTEVEIKPWEPPGNQLTEKIGTAYGDYLNLKTNTWATFRLTSGQVGSRTILGKKVIFGPTVGGENTAVDIFDSENGTWTSTTVDSNSDPVTFDPYLVFAGGSKGATVSAVASIYDSSKNTWFKRTLSEARTNILAENAGGLWWFCGGLVRGPNDWVPSRAIDTFEPSTGTWSNLIMPEKMEEVLYTNHKNLRGSQSPRNIFAIGQKVVFMMPKSVLVLNKPDRKMTYLKVPTAPRWDMGADVVGNKVIFVGGHLGSSKDKESFLSPRLSDSIAPEEKLSPTVNIFDVESATWSEASLAKPHNGTDMAVVGNKAVFWHEGEIVVDIYDAQDNTWSKGSITP